jgi:hypothetical protein
MLFLKRLGLTLGILLCYAALLFPLPRELIPWWLALLAPAAILAFFAAIRAYPGKKRLKALQEEVAAYKGAREREEGLLLEAKLIGFACPACGKESPFASYLEKDACPACASPLWASRAAAAEGPYGRIIAAYGEIKAYYASIHPAKLRRIRRRALLGS